MGQDTEELKRDIEHTRADMSTTLDAIGDRVTPGRVVERNKNKVKNTVGSVRDRVMGTAHDAKSALTDTASSAGESASSGIETVKGASDAVRSHTQGAPLVTGAIAFGIGFLVAAAFPASASEKDTSAKVVDALEPVKSQLTEAAHEVADHLKEPMKETADAVKTAATDGVDAVKSAAQDASEATKDQAKGSVEKVKSESTSDNV